MKVAREQHECHVANVVGIYEAGVPAQLEWWLPAGVEHLRGVLYGWLATCIDEFLVQSSQLAETFAVDLVCFILERC